MRGADRAASGVCLRSTYVGGVLWQVRNVGASCMQREGVCGRRNSPTACDSPGSLTAKRKGYSERADESTYPTPKIEIAATLHLRRTARNGRRLATEHRQPKITVLRTKLSHHYPSTLPNAPSMTRLSIVIKAIATVLVGSQLVRRDHCCRASASGVLCSRQATEGCTKLLVTDPPSRKASVRNPAPA